LLVSRCVTNMVLTCYSYSGHDDFTPLLLPFSRSLSIDQATEDRKAVPVLRAPLLPLLLLLLLLPCHVMCACYASWRPTLISWVTAEEPLGCCRAWQGWASTASCTLQVRAAETCKAPSIFGLVCQ
jgi:hypothetical protein